MVQSEVARQPGGRSKGWGLVDYEFRWGAPPESQQGVLPPTAEDPEEERWAFARTRSGEESDCARVSTRGRARTKTSAGNAWSLIYTPKPTEGQVYAVFRFAGVQDNFHTVVYRTFCPDAPIDYANGASVDHKDQGKTNNALYNLEPSTPFEQALNQNRKDRTQINNANKQDVWGLPADAAVDAPREWLGPSLSEAAEALAQRLGRSVESGSVSRSIHSGLLHSGWRFFAAPDAAADAKLAAQHARVVAALDAMDARVAASAA